MMFWKIPNDIYTISAFIERCMHEEQIRDVASVSKAVGGTIYILFFTQLAGIHL